MPHDIPASLLTLSALSLLLWSSAASGQISNAPFAFSNNPGGGVGMSVGGKQALINEKLTVDRPGNLMRGPGGILLDVNKGPGGTVITSYPNGQIIPQFRGSDIHGVQQPMAASGYGGYYVSSMSIYGPATNLYSGASISTWTGRITSGGMPVSYSNGNVVDMWTGQVLTLETLY